MKVKNKTTKSSFFKKIFIKISRILGYEIIDQSNFYLPISEKFGDQNISQIGKESLVIQMGRTEITRPIKSLDIILRTCASVNMLTQSKKRIFETDKSEYSIKTLNSIVNSINNNNTEYLPLPRYHYHSPTLCDNVKYEVVGVGYLINKVDVW